MLSSDHLMALPAKLDEWIAEQEAELERHADRNEAAEMQGSLDAFEAVREYLETGNEPLFME